MGFHNFVNTAQFSYTARDFKKNGDRYCTAPVGSREWTEFWAREDKRCAEGYTCADTWIPGRMYHWLNFTPIMKVPDDVAMKMYRENRSKVTGKVNNVVSDRIFGFPRFYEVGYEWYNFKNIAWNGGTFMGIESPGGLGVVAGKTRGAGFSYMDAQDGVYNYTFIPGSKNYYFAGLEAYLNVDGTLNKVQPMLDFINDNCIEWKQNRQKKNTLMHQRASYMDANGAERGSFSEIIGIAIDDPDKMRGKRGRKATFEESGSFRNLKKALNVNKGSMKDGDIWVGQRTIFGTGGEEGPDIEGLEDVFNDPRSFDLLEFPNIWEPGMETTSCGYFVPSYRTKSNYMDIDGNVDMIGAINSEKKIRKQLKKAKDPKILDGHKAEYPFWPKEMFKRLHKNMFNIAEIDGQIKRIETQSAINAMIRHGKLSRGEEGVKFEIQPKDVAKPIEEYPHSQKSDLEGCVSIVARPYVDHRGQTPAGMYQAVFDPYYKEEAEDLTSLFSVQIWKQYNIMDPLDEGLPVAWYTARPTQLDTAYSNLFMLLDLYNCNAQGEILGGGQGVVDYAKRTHQLERLDFEPLMMGNKEYVASSAMKNRSLLMNMPTEKKRLGLTYLANWHIQQRGVTPEGKPILNIHRVYDIAFLREMRRFNGERNADRISAAIIAQFMLKENAYKQEAVVKEKKTFYSRPLFTSDEMSVGQETMTSFF